MNIHHRPGNPRSVLDESKFLSRSLSGNLEGFLYSINGQDLHMSGNRVLDDWIEQPMSMSGRNNTYTATPK